MCCSSSERTSFPCVPVSTVVVAITQSIVCKIADREEADPRDLPPLYETIDPEHLQGLIESTQDNTAVSEFTYYGYDVSVGSNGNIKIDGE